MEIESIKISGNNYQLSATIAIPNDISTKVPGVVFYHGMPSKSKPRYVERAEKLAENGIAALAFDFRGCGESDGKLGEIAIKDWLDDAILAFDYLTEQSFVDKNRIGIAGKSFGGYVSALISEAKNVQSIVMHAPAVFKDEWFGKPYEWDPTFKAERIAYRKTPEAFTNKAISAIQKYNNPLLIIGSEFDTMCPRPIVEKYYEECPSEDKKLVWIKNADHSLTKPEWDNEYTSIMIEWFKKTLL